MSSQPYPLDLLDQPYSGRNTPEDEYLSRIDQIPNHQHEALDHMDGKMEESFQKPSLAHVDLPVPVGLEHMTPAFG